MSKLFNNLETVLKVEVMQDECTEAACKAFDVPFKGTTEFTLPAFTKPKDDWGMMLIVGPSGSGKSSILREHFPAPQEPKWQPNKAIVSQFATPEEAMKRLSGVGLNSIPSWLRPRHVLSNGEGHRADLARALVDGAVIDEFTSVVNREAAKSASVGVRRLVDQLQLRNVVLATCHYDVIEWLQPDWLFDTMTGVMTPRRSLRPRPAIELEIAPCSTALWPVFAPHHYLTADIAIGANCWAASWDGLLVGFASTIPFPHGSIENGRREHRTVILPDYQGFGLGMKLSNAIAKLHRENGYRYFSRTAHPRMGEYRNRSPLWRPTSINESTWRPTSINESTARELGEKREGLKKSLLNRPDQSGWKVDNERVCFSHEFIGCELGEVVGRGVETADQRRMF